VNPEIAAVLISISATTLGAVIALWVRFEHRVTVLETRMDLRETHDEKVRAVQFSKPAKPHSGGLC